MSARVPTLTSFDVLYRAARHVLLSSCRAVHQQLSAVTQSYPHVQCFLAEGSDRALSEL